jgi:hypothetical protein
MSTSVSVNVRRSEAHSRMAVRLAFCRSSTVWPSVISWRVCGRDCSARARSRSPLSISRPRSSPDPSNAWPSSSITIRRFSWSIEPTNSSRLSSICSTGIGMLVRFIGMTAPSSR